MKLKLIGVPVKEYVEHEVLMVYKNGKYDVRREWDCPMGYKPIKTWNVYFNDTQVWFFKTKKMAILSVDMMRNDIILNTGDIELRMVQWFDSEGLEIPKGL